MMRGKITLIAIASFIIYIFLAATLFFSIPFMVTWGSEKSWYMKLVIFAQGFPLNLTDKDGEIHLGFILVNAFFWTLFFALILYFVALITNKKAK
jgi:hypothetical protein